MTFNEQDFSWAAGVIEGEGCFSIFQRKTKAHKECKIICEMTDEDTIYKLQKELNVGKISFRKGRKGQKDSWILAIQKQSDVFDTLIRIMPYLSIRRLTKAKELFSYLEPKLCK